MSRPYNKHKDRKPHKITTTLIKCCVEHLNRDMSLQDIANRHRVSKAYVSQLAKRLRAANIFIPKVTVRVSKITQLIAKYINNNPSAIDKNNAERNRFQSGVVRTVQERVIFDPKKKRYVAKLDLDVQPKQP